MRVTELTTRYLGWLVAALFAVATIAMTWPLAPKAGSAVQDPGDPLFEIWIMRAVQYRLVHDPFDLYQANAFHPFEHSLAYSEEAISTALLTWPVYLLTGNDVLAYNLVFLTSFWLVGFAVYLLARELDASPGAAFVAGLAAAFAPARFGHLSHLNMLVLGWLPLALWALLRWWRGGRNRYLALAGAALAIQLLASLHLAVFSSLALALFLPCLALFDRQRAWGAGRWNRRDLALLALALAVPYLLLAPTIWAHIDAGREYAFSRPRFEVEQLSATSRSYVSVSVGNDLWGGMLGSYHEGHFPGAVVLVGAALAALAWRRWAVWFLAALAIVAAVLSFGFEVHLGGISLPLPWTLLYEHVSAVRNIRGVGRFGLLAALGYSALWRRLRPRLGRHAERAGLALTALLALAVCAELRSDVGAEPAPGDAELAIYDWLDTQPAGPVAEFPADGLFDPASVPPRGLFEPIRYMYGSTRHWNPILAGYSSYIPPVHLQIVNEFRGRDGAPSMVTAKTVGLLQDLGIRWVLIHRLPGYDFERAVAAADALPELRRAGQTTDAVAYELAPRPRELLLTRGTVEIDERAYASGVFDVVVDVIVRVPNPWENLALAHLEWEPTLRLRWERPDGSLVKEDELALPAPWVLQPEGWATTLPAVAPAEPGEYVLQVSDAAGLLPEATEQVAVVPGPSTEVPLLRLERLEWDDTRPLRPGDTLHVDVTWEALADIPADFAATLQVLDAAGERRAQLDLVPGAGMPPTSTWRAGQQVTLSFDVPLDPALPAGEYRLLAAIYAYQPGYPRLPIVLPDGSVATELIDDGPRLGSP